VVGGGWGGGGGFVVGFWVVWGGGLGVVLLGGKGVLGVQGVLKDLLQVKKTVEGRLKERGEGPGARITR